MESRSSGPARGSERPWLRGLAFSVAGSLGLAIILALATLMFGCISGEEFCPATFSRRSFTYWEIPLIGSQVSPIDRDDITNRFENQLKARKYIGATQQPFSSLSWHLVKSRRSGLVTFAGDAAILCRYLDTRCDEDYYWQEWTEQHPELAQVLWPLVAQVGQQRLYLFVPELFELAEQATNAAAFRRALRASLARNYARLAAIQQDLDQHESALELWDQALVYAPGDAESRRKREVSLAALGRSESSARTTPPTGP